MKRFFAVPRSQTGAFEVATQLGRHNRRVRGALPCHDAASRCTKSYEYDARERVTKEVRSGGGGSTKEITYGLDAAGNVKEEARPDGLLIKRCYQGNQLIKVEASKKDEAGRDVLMPLIEHYLYDGFGNLACITKSAGTLSDCHVSEGAPPGKVVAAYGYDGLNRLTGFRAWKYRGELDTQTKYVPDALDRPVEETERHGERSKRTEFTYLGLSDDVAEEREFRGGQQERTKSYGYDAFGHRLSMTDTRPRDNGGPDYTKDYGYGYDVHGSVSLLVELSVDGAAEAKASYGYNAYGDQDSDLSEERVPTGADLAGEQVNTDKFEPLNPYRYSGKRIDTGTATGEPNGADKQSQEDPQALDPGSGNLDMGARRFSPDTGRFLQEDQYDDALADLDLSADPLTANRYSLAAGNPVSYIETDGHRVAGNKEQDCYGCQNGDRPRPSSGRRGPGYGGYVGSRGGAPIANRSQAGVRRPLLSAPPLLTTDQMLRWRASDYRYPICAVRDTCGAKDSDGSTETPEVDLLLAVGNPVAGLAKLTLKKGAKELAEWQTNRLARSEAAKAPRLTQTSVSGAFRHGPFAGQRISDVAAGLRSGAISPSQLPVEVIRRDGALYALNNRSTLALRRGGIDSGSWTLRDVTGNSALERKLSQRLAQDGIPDGSDVIRVRGAGPSASAYR